MTLGAYPIQEIAMQLKRFTDLGLRVLVFLSDKTDRPTALIDIADALQWNKNQLIKVERFMMKAGWITAVRGRTGGLLLAKAPSEYRLGDLVKTLEGVEHLVNCFEPRCPFAGACGVKTAIDEAQQAFFNDLNRRTLADVATASGCGRP